MNAPSEKKPNPKANLTIGIWNIALETRRLKIRSEKEVRSSDTGDGGKGTLLRTEKHSMRMICHTVAMVSDKADRILLSVCIQGSRTTVTKTVPSNRTTPSDKEFGKDSPTADVKTSSSLKQASELLARILRIDTSVALKVILSPLAEETDETAANEVETPAYVEA